MFFVGKLQNKNDFFWMPSVTGGFVQGRLDGNHIVHLRFRGFEFEIEAPATPRCPSDDQITWEGPHGMDTWNLKYWQMKKQKMLVHAAVVLQIIKKSSNPTFKILQ